MNRYRHLWELEKDLTRLIAEGVTLRDLYDAWLTIEDVRGRSVDASSARLRYMSEHWRQSPDFVWIRLNELFGGLVVPHTDDYVLAMIGYLAGRWEQNVRLHFLRHDSELRNEIFWRIFEVEGGGEISLTNVDKLSGALNWNRTVIELANEGSLDRGRLLHSCLEALSRDFGAYRAGWFSQLYNALDPTPAEAAADEDLLRRCLASPVTASVSLGVNHLAAIQKNDLLDAPEFVEACAPALSGPKTAAMRVLRMLGTIAADQTAPIDGVVDAVSAALAHPHAEVQRAAVRLLLKLGRADLALGSRDALAPAVAAELLPEDAVVRERGASVRGPGDSHRDAQSGSATSHQFSDGTLSPASSLSPAGSLVPAQPVRPWSDADARERFSALLEFGTSALELELALAWLAITENAEQTLAPLAKRAQKIDRYDGRFWIAELVLVAVDPHRPYLAREIWPDARTLVVNPQQTTYAFGAPKPVPSEEERTVLPSLVARMREVASVVQGRARRRRLLATPTDTHGWIDPDALLHRLGARRLRFPVDLTQAVLRVPRADRGRVLRATRSPSPVITETVTTEWYPQPSAKLKPNGAPEWVWWRPTIIGARTTEPLSTQPALIPSSPERTAWNFPSRGASPLVASALGLVTPASSAPLVAVAIPLMFEVTSQVNHAAGPILDALAAHPGPWTPEAVQVVALGMAALDAGLRAQSAELFAAAVPARISAKRAAIGFAACQPAIALGRWTASLSDAATIAPAAVIDLLTHLLPELAHNTRGIGALIGVLANESVRHHREVTDPDLRQWLGAFMGASNAARMARAALAARTL